MSGEEEVVIKIAGATRSGAYKENEDSYGFRQIRPGRADIVVVDGAGHGQGSPLSGFSTALVHRSLRLMAIYGSPGRTLKMLGGYGQLKAEWAGSRAAVLVASIVGGTAYLAWEGDVSAWRLDPRARSQERLTQPHRDPSGALTRWIGSGSDASPETCRATLREGQILLLATDGLRCTDMESCPPTGPPLPFSKLPGFLVGRSPGPDDATALLAQIRSWEHGRADIRLPRSRPPDPSIGIARRERPHRPSLRPPPARKRPPLASAPALPETRTTSPVPTAPIV